MVGPSACALPGDGHTLCVPGDRPPVLYHRMILLRCLHVPRIVYPVPVPTENNACDGVDAQGRTQLADYGANYPIGFGPEERLHASALLHVASSWYLVASARAVPVVPASLISAVPVDNLVEERAAVEYPVWTGEPVSNA